MEEKPPVNARQIVTTINEILPEPGAPFKAQSASWTDAPTPDDAGKIVTQFERWSTSLPAKATHAQLATRTHQVAIQRA